jgi:signal transduction histidine kinase
MNNLYYLKNFQSWQNFWAIFFVLLGFLFILYEADFSSFEVKRIFIVSYWSYFAVVVMFNFITGGLLRPAGVKILEFRDKRLVNDNVEADGSIIDSITNKDLLKLYGKVKQEPVLLLKRYLIHGAGLGVFSVVATGFGGGTMDTMAIMAASIAVAVLGLAFFGVLLSERLSAPLLRECKKKIHQRGILQNEKEEAQLFSLKNRIYYFIFLFFILIVVSLIGIQEITPVLLVFSFLALLMMVVTARVLFSSIYLVFKEIEEFAHELPASSGARYLTGSSYKEVLDLSRKLNRSAEKLYTSRQKRKKEKDKAGAIINNFTGPIIFADSAHKIALFNAAAVDILGMSDRDHGKKISASHDHALVDFKKVIHKEYEHDPDERGVAGGSSDPIGEVIRLEHQGEERVYRVQTSVIYNEDKNFLGVVKVFYDLTTEKAINRAKSRFISIAAHQLRTPLSSIKWIIRMALDGDMGVFNKEQARLLEKAYKSNQKIIRLIDDLLNASHIEEGKFGYHIQKENFNELLEGLLADFDHKIKNKDLEFNINKRGKLPYVHIDKEKMSLALQNVIDNAIKYTPAKGKVEINAKKKKGSLEVRVKDTGVGIPDRDRYKIFSKFYRAGNVATSETDGSGLGLFIAKNIIEGHGGEIELRSEEGKGTEVILRLPVK